MLSNEYQWIALRNNIARVMLWFWLHVSKLGCNLFDVESVTHYKLILCHGMTPVYGINVICLYDLLVYTVSRVVKWPVKCKEIATKPVTVILTFRAYWN